MKTEIRRQRSEVKGQKSATDRKPGFRSQVSGCKFQVAGFTMVELLAVITIIMILAGLVIGLTGYAGRKADLAKAQSNLEMIKHALSDYKLDYGTYPASAVGNRASSSTVLYNALWTTPLASGRPTGEKKPYLSATNFVSGTTLKDPWGVTYQYIFPGLSNAPSQYDLWSKGPDGKDGWDGPAFGLDDINNWSGQ